MENHNYDEKVKNMKEHLQNFNTVFKTDVKRLEKQVPVLITLFDEFASEIYAPSIKGNQLRTEKIKLMERFDETANKEQKKLLQQITEIDNTDFSHLVEQAFCFGFALCSQLKFESNIIFQNTQRTKDD